MTPSESEAQYDLPPECLVDTKRSHREEHKIIYPQSAEPVKVAVSIGTGLDDYIGLEIPPSNSPSNTLPKCSTRKPIEKPVFDDEPVYVNYQTIDEYVRQESAFGDATADISGKVP